MLNVFSIRLLLLSLAAAIFCVALPITAEAQSIQPPPARPVDLPRSANWVRLLSIHGCDVFRDDTKLWIVPTKKSLQSGQCSIPRLCASIRSLQWSDDSERKTKFTPEPELWNFSWEGQVPPDARIEIEFDSEALLPSQRKPAVPTGDGTILLHANQASTFGDKLRFEPQAHKNTVGYWTVPTDYATWQLKIDESGEYSMAVLQGCGSGQGGSDAVISLHQGETTVSQLEFQTVETGHFQNFQWNHLGRLKVKTPGTYQLRVTPMKIAKAALFDVRMICLVRQAK